MTFTPGARRTTWGQQAPTNMQEAIERIQGLERSLGENVRDLNSPRRAAVEFDKVTVVSPFLTPLYLALPREPAGITAIRILREPDLETPVTYSGRVNYVWEGSESRARITAIDGLTAGSPTIYRVTFLVVS